VSESVFRFRAGRFVAEPAGEDWFDIMDAATAQLEGAAGRWRITFDTEDAVPGAELIPVPAQGLFVVELVSPDGAFRQFLFDEEAEAMRFFLREGVGFATAVAAAVAYAAAPGKRP